MGSERTIYTKYREKMKKMVNSIKNVPDVFSDNDFADYHRYFSKGIDKEDRFLLYRYSSLYYKGGFSLPLDCLYLSGNGNLNDVFEGLPTSFYDIYSATDYLQKVPNLCYVKCFTETYTNNLMWAHYADEFKGVCIEYDIKKIQDTSIRTKFFPVYYSNERKIWIDKDSIVNYWDEIVDDDVISDAQGIFLQKADYWKYEKEWRICFMNRDPHKTQTIQIPFPCVSAIYLGPRATMENICQVIAVAKEYEDRYNQPVKIYRMVFDDNTYELHPQEVDT